MKFPWANIALLIFLISLTLSGYLGLVNGAEASAWRLWLHAISAYGLTVLFGWKSTIILDAFRRKKRWTRERVIFLVMLILLLLTVLLGLLWTFNGPLYLGGFSLVSLHIYLAVPVMLLLLWHLRRMKFIFRVQGSLSRRLFVGTAVSAAAGILLWQATEAGKAIAGLLGAERRFTGSYETGRFPTVSWLFDAPSPLAVDHWILHIEGAVSRPFSLAYDELLAQPPVERTAVLDCTGGWYTTQVWAGVPLRVLLAQAGLLDTAMSVTVISHTGYWRRFPLAVVDQMLLAHHVAGTPLSHGHGAPVRLVVPQRRGYDWVKWVTQIRVDTSPAIWQPPLPLR